MVVPWAEKEGNVLGLGSAGVTSATRRLLTAPKPDYSVAVYTVKLKRCLPNEMLELSNFDGKIGR